MLELIHWEPNGSYLKPLIALNEKGLPFHSRYVDVLSFEQYRPGFLAASQETRLNQEGEGPVLLHDGKQITESLFMIEYLEDAFPEKPLRPADPLGQNRILAWARFINEVFMPGANTLGCHTYLAPHFKGRNAASFEDVLARIPMTFLQEGWRLAITDGYSPELLEDSQRKVGLAVRRIEDALASSDWLVGNAYSLADIDAFAICNSLPTLTPALVNATSTPRLIAWLERIRARPAVQAALAVSRTGKPEQAFAPGPEHSRWG
ncbi:MAG TPA: glutathione S-transferase family protein [Steroidobacteraceae bacterium]|jgi:glutathione S-transferase|nr:glutathione S-transferase family protein [Steroidobacteraceae bacterium]